MSFADLESRTNAACMRKLWNAVATVGLPVAAAGQEFQVIFDNDYTFVDEVGAAASAPMAAALESSMSQAVRDALEDGDEGAVRLTIKGISYSVVEPKPDGTGWIRMRLRV